MNITEFLEARVAEDEKRANYYGPLAMGTARVLAECAAKRAVVRRYQSFHATRRANWMNQNYVGAMEELLFVLNTMADTYKDHPDYRQEWAA